MTSHFITLNPDMLPECRLHYITHGSADKPPVLCIHGLSCNAHDFDHLARAISDEFYVISVDMPGRGLSGHLDVHAAYDNLAYVGYCFALLDALSITSVRWIGASMGGMMAMIANQLKPDLISHIMLNDIGSVLSGKGLSDIMASIRKRYQQFPSLDACDEIIRGYADDFNIIGDELYEPFRDSRIIKHDDGTCELRNDPAITAMLEVVADGATELDDISLEEQWALVRCPVLLFRGAQSTLLTDDTARAMAAADHADVTYHEIPHVGHMPNLMVPEQTNIVRNWLLTGL